MYSLAFAQTTKSASSQTLEEGIAFFIIFSLVLTIWAIFQRLKARRLDQPEGKVILWYKDPSLTLYSAVFFMNIAILISILAELNILPQLTILLFIASIIAASALCLIIYATVLRVRDKNILP